MAATINKQQVLNQVLSGIDPAPEPDAPLPVLEQFIYGICRENATPEMAQQAYDNLTSQFFDWNEVRVSSPRELEEAMPGLLDTEARANRIIAFLQEVFETTFSFDLEAVQKKGLKQAGKTLQGLSAASEYIVSWVVQRSLGGHAIPLDSSTLRACKRLGLVENDVDTLEAARTTLEHLVPKAKGSHFTDALSILAEQACWDGEPRCGACPAKSTCPSAETESVASSRTARKPR